MPRPPLSCDNALIIVLLKEHTPLGFLIPACLTIPPTHTPTMKRIGTVLLTVVATALVVVAKPPHSIIAALLHGQSTSGLYVRSGIDPSSIASQCQPSCTPVIQKLDACRTPSCECTQANLDALAVCINCLVPLGPASLSLDSPGTIYTDFFTDYCAAQRILLNAVSITATPTGTATTGDPLSMFEAPTPTAGATAAVTAELPPLIPSYTVQTAGQATPKSGSASGLNPFGPLA
ncbi:hypothetical protein BGY98DRAFT_268103 [Russula aff. rugulosa BPL654]|nr:hypothetical protein BGY98DRAFT_268103 [Russula aff. rugulosa BPL654]